jgi:hypothetical protein
MSENSSDKCLIRGSGALFVDQAATISFWPRAVEASTINSSSMFEPTMLLPHKL